MFITHTYSHNYSYTKESSTKRKTLPYWARLNSRIRESALKQTNFIWCSYLAYILQEKNQRKKMLKDVRFIFRKLQRDKHFFCTVKNKRKIFPFGMTEWSEKYSLNHHTVKSLNKYVSFSEVDHWWFFLQIKGKYHLNWL